MSGALPPDDDYVPEEFKQRQAWNDRNAGDPPRSVVSGEHPAKAAREAVKKADEELERQKEKQRRDREENASWHSFGMYCHRIKGQGW
jgi:hypothetical protein